VESENGDREEYLRYLRSGSIVVVEEVVWEAIDI